MKHACAARRFVLLALTLLSACAASNPSLGDSSIAATGGAIGDFLAGRYALSEGDTATAATYLLKAYKASPADPELTLDTFIATLSAGRPEALALARKLPDSQVAQLLLANEDIKRGAWPAAEARFRGLPHQGLTQLLQPLLLAWAQQGDGQTAAALATLRPYVENPRIQTLFALHAAMIADLAGRTQEAGRLYQIASANLAQPNLRLVQILASWQARSGQAGEVEHTLAVLPQAAPELGIAEPGMLAAVTQRPVPNAADGVAESYFTFAALLRQQGANDFAMVVLRLALDLRPDFTAARLLASDILGSEHRTEAALAMLKPVPATDPIISVVKLRRVALIDQLGHSDEAVTMLEAMARDYPNSPLPEQRLGDILREQKKFPAAVAAYDRALGRISTPSESDWVLYYDRGVALEQSNQWPKAEADFKHALTLSPDQPYVLNYLGYSLADKGVELAEARRMIQTAAQARPNDGAIVDSLGWVLYRQGHYREAVKTLERAVEMEPEDSTINGHLGDAYWAAGRKIEARYQWRRALTLNPTPADAVKLEAKLTNGEPAAVLTGK